MPPSGPFETRPPAIICIGRNYADHAAEMGHDPVPHPIVFYKNPASIIGDGDPIIIPSICDSPHRQVDFEGELGVVLGLDCRDVSLDRALDYVSGYTAANDVSARWWQKFGSGGQYSRGKSFDTFCPVGTITPAADVPDPQVLTVRTLVNGEVMQEASTSTMIFTIAQLISELSQGTTLLAGSLMLTGTPAGVGAARTPPRFLSEGDVVEVQIDGVGSVRSPVSHA